MSFGKRGRGQRYYDCKLPSEDSGSKGPRERPFKRRGHPSHLQGRDIGLYYRDRKRMKNSKNQMPRLELPLECQQRIQRLLGSAGREYSEDIIFEENSQFRKEFLDITSVSFNEKLHQCLELGLLAETSQGLNDELHSEHLKKNENPLYVKMLEFRKKLPAYQKRAEILSCIRDNRVVVISGDTGCGKTTQVGQMLLEEACAERRGANVRILITQPRRLAATSVAARIADERAEVLGTSVGYCIRLDSIPPRGHGSVEVVTAGVVLQRLQSDPALLSVSHLLMDEVHERDTTCDILLGIVKQIINKRKDLKLILMSATMDAERFCQYFGGCPLLHIPGVMFPIQEFYLEDVLELTGFQNWREHRTHGHMGYLKKFHLKRAQQEKAHQHELLMGPYVRILRAQGTYSESTLDSLLRPESENLCEELAAELAAHLCRVRPPGALLVFLPGLANISKLCRLLEEQRHLLPPILLLPLHSHLNSVDQNAIFTRPPDGIRKIIVSTNIAETSITIDDVVYVIDCGRMKLGDYDVESDVKTLQPEWVSQANAHQRRGRAGRVSNGECYRLYSRARAELLPVRPAPELLRAPVHEPLLAALLLRQQPAPAFLASLLDPPQPAAVATATILLTRMGILDVYERLTPLGVHVARLPVAPGAARMLLLAALLSATGPASSIAAVVAFRDPFILPLGKEREVEEARIRLARGSGSDQLAAAEAQRRWAELSRADGDRFCHQNFLSPRTMTMLSAMRDQFGQLLHAAKFLTSPDPDSPTGNRNAHNTGLLKALVVAGLYPNVASYRGKGSKLVTPEDGRVVLHPSSVNSHARRPALHLVYRLKQRSSDLFLHDTSPAHAIALIFFGDNFCIKDTNEGCEVWSGAHGWRTSRLTADLLCRMRGALHHLLQLRLESPRPVRWDSHEGNLLQAIIELISGEDDLNNCGEEGD